MAAGGVKVTDRGWNRLLKRIQSDQRKHVVVGIREEKGAKPYPGGDTTVAEVAAWNHYGTSRIPARPFISRPIRANQAKIKALQARLAKGFLKGKITEEQGLTLLGTAVLNLILNSINTGFPPPNAPSTKARKKSSTPLVDTSQLKGSIDMEIRDNSAKDK